MKIFQFFKNSKKLCSQIFNQLIYEILTAFDNYDDYQGAYSADPFPTLTFPTIARPPPQKTCPDLLLQLGNGTNSTRHHSE